MAHDTGHFARVYEEHVWRVYGFLAYRLADRHCAEDLTQATFERALRAWPRYDARRASVRAWLLAIATNLLTDHQRRERTRRASAAAQQSHEPGPEQRLAGAPELLDALAQLGDREREIIALRYGGDLSGSEIAELLGLSVANVQQINSRALRRLRRLLPDPAAAASR